MTERKIKIKELTPLIQCKLCQGFLVDATTVIECLHTFCKSCLVKFLEDNTDCPTCGKEIHQSYPLDYISHDRTIQDLLNKLFPHIQKDEKERERLFYLESKIPNPKAPPEPKPEPRPSVIAPHDVKSDYHRNDEQLSIQLECKTHVLKPLKRRYLRCSAQATVLHLKKYVAAQLFNDISRCNDLDIICNDEILGKDHMLKFVLLSRWRFRDPPLVLHYRQKLILS